MPDPCVFSFANWLALQLAPTLLGSKNGTLLSLQDMPGQPLLSEWRQNGAALLASGVVAYLPLKSLPTRETVLFYRPDRLQRLFRQPRTREFLARRGYPVQQGLAAMLRYLQQRFQHCCPHEIGLFLGIPLKDVIGFIEARCPLEDCATPWKVFGCQETSLRLWRRFVADQLQIGQLLRYGHCPKTILCSACPYLPAVPHFAKTS